MWSVVLSVALLGLQGAEVTRGAYGVPHVRAESWEALFEGAGYAVAQDRLWQMENSRRLARGRMAEVFGPAMTASDKEVLATGYTDAEISAQLRDLPDRTRTAFEAYARGVNRHIGEARATGQLPPGYAQAGFQPEPWTPEDSAAVAIRLGQLFGRGGAGELRNLALVEYLKGRPVKDRLLDVLDDIAWADEPAAIPTVAPEDDLPPSARPAFAKASRADTERHLASLPKASLFELLPGIRMASAAESRVLAEARNVAFKTGSYALVVGRERSRLGVPLLLSAPQMGFRNPSVVHEMSLEAPGVSVVGMDVPGVPGVIIGHTKHLAWGLTSGVADTEDIFYSPADGTAGFLYDGARQDLETIERALAVKGEAARTVLQRRVRGYPVVLSTRSAHYSRRSSFWKRELSAFASLFDLYTAAEPEDVRSVAARIPLTFNLFFATTGGHTGYFYCGAVPLRAAGFDPRFPTPLQPASEWKGLVPPRQMPQVVDPKSGLIANWNNKPASWWPNFDTPVWGRVFRNSALLDALPQGPLGPEDLEMAAWRIARTEETASAFMPLIRSALAAPAANDANAEARAMLAAFQGLAIEGSHGASLYLRTFDALREELFAKPLGGFISPDLFRQALQPSLMLAALEGKTHLDYLDGRSPADVVRAAFDKAVERLSRDRGPDPTRWFYTPGSIPVAEGPPIPYGNRGTYIQIVELWASPSGRNVLPPGVAETGPHSRDQEALARAWGYKPMGTAKGRS